jgi:hypothetical protein
MSTDIEMIGMAEAARLLGCSVDALRKIVHRSKRKAAGVRLAGPTIRFYQLGSHSTIKFRRAWIDEFIIENTVDPRCPVVVNEKVGNKKTNRRDAGRGDWAGLGAGWDLGIRLASRQQASQR